MSVKLGRPLLVGGLGLSFSLWAWQSVQHQMGLWGEWGMMGALALGAGFWWISQNNHPAETVIPNEFDRETAEIAIAQAETVISQLATEAENHPLQTQLQEKLTQVKGEGDRQNLRLAITGGKGVGKTTISQQLKNQGLKGISQPCTLSETSPLFTLENKDEAAIQNALEADLVLFVAKGDLTAMEYQVMQKLSQAPQRTLLIFNKQDQYSSDERAVILQQMRQLLKDSHQVEDVLSIAADPSPIKVRQEQPDGSLLERLETPDPDLQVLRDRLSQILATEASSLLWATTWRKATALKGEAKTALNEIRKERALPIIEQYQWIAAAAAFANPVPSLDLLATAAINGQLVMDLGNLYQQKFSLSQAQTVAGTLGTLMLKLGFVEVSTQAIATFLKSNAITFIAGGVAQGVSAAYLTRLAGLSLIEYFQQQEIDLAEGRPLNLEQLKITLQNVFQQNQRVAFLQGFVSQAVARLNPETPENSAMPANG